MDIDGMLLESKYGEYQYIIKGPVQDVWRDGLEKREQKLLVLYFERFMCEVDVQAQNQEWTDEDKVFAARKIESDLKNPMFREMWVHQRVLPGKPWPSYDETHHNQIPIVAAATGLIGEALAYETQAREPRPSVVQKLEELQSDSSVAEPAEEDELSAV